MEINLSICEVRSMTEKHSDACAVYLFSFMLINQKFIVFKNGRR